MLAQYATCCRHRQYKCGPCEPGVTWLGTSTEVEPRALLCLHMLGMCPTTEMYLQSFFIFFILEWVLTKLPRRALNSWFFCHGLLKNWDYWPVPPGPTGVTFRNKIRNWLESPFPPLAATFEVFFSFFVPGSGVDMHPGVSMHFQTPGHQMLINCVCVLSPVNTCIWLL